MQRFQFVSGFRTAAVLAVSCLAGCGGGVGDQPETVPVTGSVAYNGQPVVGATVSFWTEAASRAASGVTDKDGKFTLSMFEINDGAVPGEHVITVSKVAAGAAPATDPNKMLNDPTAMTDMMSNQAANPDAGPKSEIPEKYGNKTTTTLKETVTESGPNTFVLQLTD